MKTKIKYIIIVLFVFSQSLLALTISEINEISQLQLEEVKTIKLDCVVEWYNSRDRANLSDSLLRYTGSYQKYSEILVLDVGNKISKSIKKDLRDFGKAARENGFTEQDIGRIRRDGTLVLYEDYSFRTHGNSVEINQSEPYFEIGMLKAGLIAANGELSQGSTVNKILKDEEVLFSIDYDNGKGFRYEIICDPAIGYRVREENHYSNGKISIKYLYEDYRDINGIPYPFTQKRLRYSAGTEYANQVVKINSAEINPELTDDDFKVLINQEAHLLDFAFPLETDKETESYYRKTVGNSGKIVTPDKQMIATGTLFDLKNYVKEKCEKRQ